MPTRSRIQSVVGQADLGRSFSGQNTTQQFYGKSFSRDTRESMSRILSNYAQLIRNVRNVLPDVLEEALRSTFNKSLMYCPVDTGLLVKSGRLISGRGSNGRAFARISYGNEGAIHYASIVHERTDLHHDAPTRAKYLQSAMEEDLGEFKSRLIRALGKM